MGVEGLGAGRFYDRGLKDLTELNSDPLPADTL
jgi:hypothetical protein